MSILEALEPAGAEPDLVNGILLQDTEGTIWLCESIRTRPRVRAAGAFLRVENYPEDAAAETFDPENADVTGSRRRMESSGSRISKLYGTVVPTD